MLLTGILQLSVRHLGLLIIQTNQVSHLNYNTFYALSHKNNEGCPSNRNFKGDLL